MGRATPGVCQRVRKLLIGKGLSKYCFLKSGEEHENQGFIFALVLQKSEKVEQERELNAKAQSSWRFGEGGIRRETTG